MSSDGSPPKAKTRWLRWLAGAAISLGIAALFVAVAERDATELLGKSISSSSSTSGGGFPPAFNDPRPDLTKSGDFVNVCRIGFVPRQPGGDVDLPDVKNTARRALARAATQLVASDDAYDQAIGLFAQGIQAATYATDEYQARHACERDVSRCDDELQAVARAAHAPFSQRLAQLALSTRDARVYALAVYGCKPLGSVQPGAPACSQLSWAQWAQIEPDNATPWLYEASAADERKDTQARDEALFRASNAKVLRLHDEAPMRLSDPRLLQVNDPVTTALAYVDLIGIWAALPAPLFAVVQPCGPGLDAARRQLCSDLAVVLTERSTTLLAIALGARIGERAGWPRERVAAARERVDAINQLSAETADLSDFYSCEAIERTNRRLNDFFRYGEVAALERQVQASGRSAATLAKQWQASHPSRGGSESPSAPATK